MGDQTQVSLKVLGLGVDTVGGTINDLIVNDSNSIYGSATNGSGPVYIAKGSSGIWTSGSPGTPSTLIYGTEPIYGIISIPGVGQNYTYGFNRNKIYQFAPSGTSLAAPVILDVTTLDLVAITLNFSNCPTIFTTNNVGRTSTSNNIFCVPIVVNTGNHIVVNTNSPYIVQSVFGTTTTIPDSNQGTFAIGTPNPIAPYSTATEFTTDGKNIYALLQDSRILKITFNTQPPVLSSATVNLLSSAPINTLVNTSGPTLATGLTYIGTGVIGIDGNTGYLYAFDGYNGGSNTYKIYAIDPGTSMTATQAIFPATNPVAVQVNGVAGFTGSEVAYPNGGNMLAGYSYSGINYLFVAANNGRNYYSIHALQLGAYNTLSKVYSNVFNFQEYPLGLFAYNNTLYTLSYSTYNSIFPNSNTYTTYQLGITIYNAPICFLKGTYIYTNKGYELIENLKKGDLVNTFKDNYVPIDTIVEEEMYHDAQKERNKGQLYKLDYPEYPQLLKELYITGAHSVLVGKLTDKQKNQIIQDYGKTFATDLFDRLPAYLDEKAKVHDVSGKYTIYHLALENENNFSNYGIYANGLLVESLSKNDCVNRIY